ncbi:hypothetical protein [Pararhizobium sp. LjRoot238]|uniref:hypothetical protein n=1 Tax=Pararhizobium sp. LjRoot238 TaxID=3342293 RepID=UPI003ECF3FE2
MSDLINDPLHLSDAPAMGSREDRRQVIERLVHAMMQMVTAFESHGDAQHLIPIVQLIAVIEEMAGRIADADDATFSAIVEETASLLRTLEQRRQEMAIFTVH